MASISTHVLDLVDGRPAVGMRVRVWHRVGDAWSPVADRATDNDGRVRDLVADAAPGQWRLVFGTGPWSRAHQRTTFYPEVAVDFEMTDGHHHVPLLFGPYGYSTYRGS